MSTRILAICRNAYRLAAGMLLVPGFLLAGAGQTSWVCGAEAVDFVRDIQPIFTNHCYSCHADQSVEGGIRWDRKSALAGGDSGEAAVVPGEPENGTLLGHVRGDTYERMPPEDEGEPLNETQIALLDRGID